MRTKRRRMVFAIQPYLKRTRRPYGSLVVETYISYHNQRPDAGVVVRQRYMSRGKLIDRSKYFTVYRYGSMSKAIWHAVRWKNAELKAPIRRRIVA